MGQVKSEKWIYKLNESNRYPHCVMCGVWIICTTGKQGKEHAEFIAAAPETLRQRDKLLEVLKEFVAAGLNLNKLQKADLAALAVIRDIEGSKDE